MWFTFTFCWVSSDEYGEVGYQIITLAAFKVNKMSEPLIHYNFIAKSMKVLVQFFIRFAIMKPTQFLEEIALNRWRCDFIMQFDNRQFLSSYLIECNNRCFSKSKVKCFISIFFLSLSWAKKAWQHLQLVRAEISSSSPRRLLRYHFKVTFLLVVSKLLVLFY